MVITSACVNTIVTELTPEERRSMKLVSYMDQVYPYQKKQYIHMLNTYFDAVIAFTPYWRETARRIGLSKSVPCYVFPHGFDHTLYYPIPRKVARIFYGIPDTAFAILNLNRNQPRKRWDHTMRAYAICIKKYYDLVEKYKSKVTLAGTNANMTPPRPLKLVIGTTVDNNGSWNLVEVLEHELMLLGVPIEFGKECLVAIANPQQLSDSDINVLYNCCDIGLNTCEGEGFGLCQIEHLALGCPQVAPKIGGLQEFMNDNNSILIDAKWRYYIDKNRDGIGGIAEIGDTNDYAAAIWKYYSDPKLYSKHAKNGRAEILQNYRWVSVVDHFHRILQDIPM
jgi:glycosyltransferase involved in cell wall biosynthesis